MAVKPIVLFDSHPEVLRKKSESVRDGDDNVSSLIRDLKETLLDHSNAIGLAAPQIGVHKRVLVACLGGDEEGNSNGPLVAVINPVIVEVGNHMLDFDGCLSFPGLYAKTVRPHFMRLRGIDEHGDAFERVLNGFDAVVVHHEIDHLEGILFIDRVDDIENLYTE